MAEPTGAQKICWALYRLGEKGRPGQLEATLRSRFGEVDTAALLSISDALFRDNGRLWVRQQDGTYELTEEGVAEAKVAIRVMGPTLNSEW